MKKISLIILTFAFAVFLAACGAPAENKPANTNTNTNTSKPTAAAPTVDALIALDKQATEAWIKGDTKWFEENLSEKLVSFDGGQRTGKADLLKMIGQFKCEAKEGWKLEDPQLAKIDEDTYVVSYKSTIEGSCAGPDGKSVEFPSPTRAATVWVRNGDKWQGVFHGENPIIDPKNPPPAPEKAEAKKEEPKTDGAKKEESTASNSGAPASAKPTPGANTDALVKIHTSGWEAFKAKDAKKFEEITSKSLSFVDPLGAWHSGQADVIKLWTETMKCEGITKVGVSEGFASALSPTVEILTLKGTADGTCDGQKNGDLYTTAVYVKEGDAWKLAFMFESLPM